MATKPKKTSETKETIPEEISAADAQPAEAVTSEQPKQVTIRVRREHLLTDHSIELRRNGGDLVVEARIEDHRHSETIGAKTVQQILDENGAGQILQSDDEQIEITFSPVTGEVVSILPFAEKFVAGKSGDGEPEEE